MKFRTLVSIMLAAALMVSCLPSSMAEQETYTGTAKGFGSDVITEVILEDGKVVGLNVDDSSETYPLAGIKREDSVDQLIAAILAQGDAEGIDAHTGATFTSEAVLAVVKEALAGDAELPYQPMTPGTYTASAMGINDRIEVTITVSENRIEKAEVTYNQETPGIGAPLYDKNGELVENGGTAPVLSIPASIVKNQSLAVDGVSGATVTSNAVLKAARDALVQSGANLSNWQGQSEEKETITLPESADVVVIGAGGAGMAAAISAGQQGVNVVLLEKTGMAGGDTLVCGATYNTWDPEGQSKIPMGDAQRGVIEAALAETPVSEEHAALIAEVKAEWEVFQQEGKEGTFDSPAWYTLQTWNGGDKVGDLAVIRKYADNAYAGYEWLLPLGMEFNPNVGQGAGALWERSHYSVMNMGTGFISTYLDTIDSMENVQLFLNTKGTQLLTDENGRVVAVICVDKNGEEHTIQATKGVVIATGGYGANGEMVQSYNTTGKWDDLTHTPTTNRHAASQGDGIVMATAIGADTRDMDQIQLLYLGNLVDGGLTKYPSRCVMATTQTIFVNQEGNRFVQEDGRRDQICGAVLKQTNQMFYIVESADGSLYSDINDSAWRSADGFTREFLEENGFIFVADTLEELAEKIGVPAENLKNSVDTYNACYDVGEDQEFGRTNFDARLEHGPWVATPRQASIHHTMGGLRIDPETRVLTPEGEIIKGLYAAGEVIGGLHGGNRLGGNAVTDVVVFGKLAGENAANEK